jgi:DNA repair protein RecO (recombination protein O)
MAIIHTKAIVFKAIKYGETSLIVTCFTLEEGIKSYMIKGILNAKKGKLKTAYFQPLTQLQLIANHTHKNRLHSIKEAQISYSYHTVHTSIVKQTIILFLSEILSSTIREEEQNKVLFSYIETALIWLDTHTEVSNFHLLFLLNLSRFLGFYPDTSNAEKKAFNLIEGKFTDIIYEKGTIQGKELTIFKKLLGTHFDTIHNISFHQKERQTILRILIQYFRLHLEDFKTPKSLDTIFN